MIKTLILRSIRAVVFLGWAVLTTGLSPAQETPVNPLQIDVVRVGKTSEPLLFQVSLHNAGDQDLILNLGVMLGNGRRQYPDAIHLRLSDKHGKTLLLDLIGPAVINGRLDPLVVPLLQGATFAFLVKLADYRSPKANVWKIDLAPGRYILSAEYKGMAVTQRAANLDMQGIALMPYWTGTAESKALSFTVPPAMGGKHE